MATRKEHVEGLLKKLAPLDVTAKPMFGEYGLYFKGKNFGLVCDNTLFIKVTEPGAEIAGRISKAPPYPGAKPAFRITKAKLDDQPWLLQLIEVTSDAQPQPKARKSR